MALTLLRSTLIGVAFAALFYSTPVAAAVDEHIERKALHPCGEAGLDFKGLTGWFQYRWQASFRDLTDRSVDIWLRHHGLEDTDITVVRLFRSRQLPSVAVLHGRRFVNYLDGKPLVDMLCIVRVKDVHVLEYPMKKIEEILNAGGTDT